MSSSLNQKNYREADLLTIRIPLSNPYQPDQIVFEQIDGEIVIKGTIYRYIKRKVVAGQLILVCLADINKMRLKNAGNDFFKTTNDLFATAHSKKQVPVKNMLVKYIDHDYEQNPLAQLSCQRYNKNTSTRRSLTYTLEDISLGLPDQPPETTS